jgi:hypothetical protein
MDAGTTWDRVRRRQDYYHGPSPARGAPSRDAVTRFSPWGSSSHWAAGHPRRVVLLPGLSRMKGNLHVRFLEGGGLATARLYSAGEGGGEAATLSYSVSARSPALTSGAVADLTPYRQVECRLPLSNVDSPLLFRADSSKGKRWNCLKASFSVGLFAFAFILVVQNTGERYFVSTYLNE